MEYVFVTSRSGNKGEASTSYRHCKKVICESGEQWSLQIGVNDQKSQFYTLRLDVDPFLLRKLYPYYKQTSTIPLKQN